MGVVVGGWGPRVMVQGAGDVLAEQRWRLGDKGPLAEVGEEHRTDTAELWEAQGMASVCDFATQLNLGAV